MTMMRINLAGFLCIATALLTGAGLVVLYAIIYPLLGGLDEWQRVLVIVIAIASASGALVTAAIVAFGILPATRHHAREWGRLQSTTNVLERRSKELENAALTDALTGLHNRRFFDEATRFYLEEFGKIGRDLGFLLLDLDHFKSVNDVHGHDVGDEVLKAVAKCLAQFTRHHDIVARLGGEEFAVVTPNMTLVECETFAERLRDAIGKLVIRIADVDLRLTVSIGVAMSRRDDDVNRFYKRADVNLYRAKQTGRNRVCA